METIEDVKKEIIVIAKKLSTGGVVGTFEGNISRRIGDKVILTPTGQSKDSLDTTKLATTDSNGNWIDGPLAPTSETPMHTAIYKMRPDIGAIVHCHAPYCTAYAIANQPIECKSSPEFLILFGMIPLIPYGTPGSTDIYKGMSQYINCYDVFLLANHGMIAVGKNALDAYSKCISLELILHTLSIKEQLFPKRNNDLPEAEVKKLLEIGRNRHGIQK